jgi:gamma-glutamyltranspeptidase/glutathione hydrolase
MRAMNGSPTAAWAVWLIYIVASSRLCGQPPRADAKFLPDQWPKEDLEHYLALQSGGGFDWESRRQKRIEPQKSAVSSRVMIAGTSEPLAVHAGLEVLKHGGNAADAALTTSLAQIALTAGAAISYAGIMTAVYYDAASDKVYTVDAGYNTVQNEKEPLTIPQMGEHSGRTVLVPGFMSGVQAMHDRFGKLPFASLFGPAIWIAEKGFAVTPVIAGWLRSQKDFITRLPESKRVLTKQDGNLYRTDDIFRQPELAVTLRRIADEGSGYMYKGEWARHFVDIVQREGGKVTLEDLAAYRPVLKEQSPVPYREYQVFALGPPNGGATTLLSLKMAEAADLKKYGHYARLD